MSAHEDASRPSPGDSPSRPGWSGGTEPPLARSQRGSEGSDSHGPSSGGSGDEGNSSAGSEYLESTPEDLVPTVRGSEPRWQRLEGSSVLGYAMGGSEPELRASLGLRSSSGLSEGSGGQWPTLEDSGGGGDLRPRRGGSGGLGPHMEGSGGEGLTSGGSEGSGGLGIGRRASERLGPSSREPGDLRGWFGSLEHLGLPVVESAPRSGGTGESDGSGGLQSEQEGLGRSETPGQRSGGSGDRALGLGASADVGSEPGGSDSPGPSLGASGPNSGKPDKLGGPWPVLGGTGEETARQEDPSVLHPESAGPGGPQPRLRMAAEPGPRSGGSSSPSLTLEGCETGSRESGGPEGSVARRSELQQPRSGGSGLSESPGMNKPRESGSKRSEDLAARPGLSGTVGRGSAGSGGPGPRFGGPEGQRSILGGYRNGSPGLRGPSGPALRGSGCQGPSSGGSQRSGGVPGIMEFGRVEPGSVASGGLPYRAGGSEGLVGQSPRPGGREHGFGGSGGPPPRMGRSQSMGPASVQLGGWVPKCEGIGSASGGPAIESEGSRDTGPKPGQSGRASLRFARSGERAPVPEGRASSGLGGPSDHGSLSRGPEVFGPRQKDYRGVGPRSAGSAGLGLGPRAEGSPVPGPRSGGPRHLGTGPGGYAIAAGDQGPRSGAIERLASARTRGSALEPRPEASGLEPRSGGPIGQRPGLRGSELEAAGPESPVPRLRRSLGVERGSVGSRGPVPVPEASEPGWKQSGASSVDPKPGCGGSGGPGPRSGATGGLGSDAGQPEAPGALSDRSEVVRSKLAGPDSRGSLSRGSPNPRPRPAEPGLGPSSEQPGSPGALSEGSEVVRSKLGAPDSRGPLSRGSPNPGPRPAEPGLRPGSGQAGDAGPSCGGAGGAGGAGSCCTRCGGVLGPGERVRVTGTGAHFHPGCFVCAQCFQRLPRGLFFEFEGRMYCERDFLVLYAPCCRLCGEFVIGRVIRAMGGAWHPGCFRCDVCEAELVGTGFVRSGDRHLCHPCHAAVAARGGHESRCRRCRLVIEGGPLLVGGDAFHPEHFSCAGCGRELGEDAEERGGRLLCRPCRDRAGPTCGACRRPLEGRGVTAMGRDWHVEHFVCAKCEKPFLGHRHVERHGLAYCETHYNQLFGDVCFHCNRVVEGDVLSALNKTWCVTCFCCSACNARLNVKTRFVEVDQRPVCKRCFSRLPQELRRRLASRGRESRAPRGRREGGPRPAGP